MNLHHQQTVTQQNVTLPRKGKGCSMVSVVWSNDRIWNQVGEGHLCMPVADDCDYITYKSLFKLLLTLLTSSSECLDKPSLFQVTFLKSISSQHREKKLRQVEVGFSMTIDGVCGLRHELHRCTVASRLCPLLCSLHAHRTWGQTPCVCHRENVWSCLL